MVFHSVATTKVGVDDVDGLREKPRLVFSKVGMLHFLEEVAIR
jgi:hypothetical protein